MFSCLVAALRARHVQQTEECSLRGLPIWSPQRFSFLKGVLPTTVLPVEPTAIVIQLRSLVSTVIGHSSSNTRMSEWETRLPMDSGNCQGSLIGSDPHRSRIWPFGTLNQGHISKRYLCVRGGGGGGVQVCLEGRRGVFTGWDCDPSLTIKQFTSCWI